MSKCTIDCLVAHSNASGHTWFFEAIDRFEIVTSDVSLVSGVESVTVTDISITADSPAECSDSMTTTITLVNPCLNAIISGPSLTDQTVQIDDPSEFIYNVGAFTDSVSIAKGDTDFCGGLHFEFWRTDSNTEVMGLITA